jgi:predicted amidohydrolase
LLPYRPELDQGVSPGRELRVFDADFGRVAVMNCFDSWFPEVARALAQMGAEVILLPNAGYFEDLMPARAADNGVCIVASSLYHAAGVWESSGCRAGNENSKSSREAPSAVLSFEHHPADGLLLATVDLSKKYSPHWKGGPMTSAPALRGPGATSLKPWSQLAHNLVPSGDREGSEESSPAR